MVAEEGERTTFLFEAAWKAKASKSHRFHKSLKGKGLQKVHLGLLEYRALVLSLTMVLADPSVFWLTGNLLPL